MKRRWLSYQKLRMLKHPTALKKQKRKAEEFGGDTFGFAPFCSFLDDFNPIFQARTRPTFYKRASQYLSGLFLRDRRRNIEKIQQSVAEADYQSLHHFIHHSPWSHRALIAKISQHANQLLGGTEDTALIIDPTSFPKKGRHSVGVARQYSGRLGKVDNCQVAVVAALVKGQDSVLVNQRLYLPKSWTEDPSRLLKAGVPEEEQHYRSSADLALELIAEADAHQLQYQWIGMDAEFAQPALLTELHTRGKHFLVDIRSNTYLYRSHPHLKLRPKAGSGKLSLKAKPVQASDFKPKRSGQGWKTVLIKEGRKGLLREGFRHQHVWLWDRKSTSPPIRCHLIIRRSKDASDQGWRYKYSLSNAPEKTPLKTLAYRQSQRFWVEQAIRDAKDSLGMAEFQCRSWRAWHHHMALTFLAGLYVLKLRMENRSATPLLSIGDIKELLAFLFPKRVQDLDELWDQILTRHRQLEAGYRHASSRAMQLQI